MPERLRLDLQNPTWVEHQHLERYRHASQFVQGRVVLDAACGTGYGSALLMDAGATRVDGIDLSVDAVSFAETHYKRPGLRYQQGDVTKLPFADCTYDIYVSFETIEHIPDENAYLEEAHRVLKPGGLFIVSTPNRLLLAPRTTLDSTPHNPFHVREYSQLELSQRLNSRFEQVHILGQTVLQGTYSATIRSLGWFSGITAARCHQLCKLVFCRWDNASSHKPTELTDRQHPEFFVASCRTTRR